MKIWLIGVIVGAFAMMVVAVAVPVINHRQEQHHPAQIIEAWAHAAEQGDTSRMRDLMEPNAFLFATWRERWTGMRTTMQVQPGHAVSSITQQGDTTSATVHFRTVDGALCVPVQVDRHGKLTIAGTQYRCAFLTAGAQP